MSTVQEVSQDVKLRQAQLPELAFYVGDGQSQRNEAAWQRGYETGMAGKYPQGTQTYDVCGPEWDSYAEGYDAGRLTFMLVTASNVYSGPSDNEYPTYTTTASRNEFLALIGGER